MRPRTSARREAIHEPREDTAMIDDVFPNVLRWLVDRQGHKMEVDLGIAALEPAVVRGREPWKFGDEQPETYALDVYVRVTTLRIAPDKLGAAFEGNELTLDIDGRRVTLIDTDQRD
jgi:hypothetical protein